MKGYKFRIFPSESQKTIIENTFNCCRYVWNGFLALKEYKYRCFEENIYFKQMSAILTEVKKTDLFLKDVDSTALQQTLKQLDDTYKKFFKKLCNKPRFKSKNNPKNSYKSTNTKLKGDKVFIPKVGEVEVLWSRRFTGRIISATVSKSTTNKYFISFCVDENTPHLPQIDKEVGIDLGLKTFAVSSDGLEVKAPKPMWKYLARFRKLQRRFSKMKNSNNRLKLKLKIAKLHERVKNIRQDFLHKITTKLIRENQSIYLEDLNVSGMSKNKKLAKAILDCGFGYFVQMMKTKATMYGRTVFQIDRWFPSSKICSCCGNYKVDLKLSDRVYKCDCGLEIDRDFNASINILLEGKKSIRG
ncbi:RNA-guided endonuclease InsQ/TnpB family protein [Cetobacterium sp.]|uniref:RNA-guided endonuclease InsQ/TnpB family protein n=1 Tax=Cetobacterium sp. TaxID=2071632 RepID=UPI003F3A54F4